MTAAFAASAVFGVLGCGGETTTAPDLSAPAAFESRVLDLCDIQPNGEPFSTGRWTALLERHATFQPEAARYISWLEQNDCQHAQGSGLLVFLILEVEPCALTRELD